ncbi:ATP-binding protein [Streptomyces sp. NPDC127084]|uniref:ATP-binding protein n=1 Tax=Streptomyces sp. NPDC127084 TaxID=3347133 RepID=UPI00365B8F3C
MSKHEHAERSFTADPASIAEVRSFAERTLKAWHMTAQADDVQLCVSELASNAVNHGTRPGSPSAFRVRMDASDARIRIEIEDSDPLTAPRVRQAAHGDTGGRGMQIVDALASAWGYENHAPEGKAVWSEFHTTPAST